MAQLSNQYEQAILSYIRTGNFANVSSQRLFHFYDQDPGETFTANSNFFNIPAHTSSVAYDSVADEFFLLVPFAITFTPNWAGAFSHGYFALGSSPRIGTYRIRFNPSLSFASGETILLPANSIRLSIKNVGQVIANYVLRYTLLQSAPAFRVPDNIFIGLFSNLAGNNTGTEITTTLGLTRTSISRMLFNEPTQVGMSYSNLISLGTPTSNGTINVLGFYTAATGGDLLFYVNLPTPINAVSGTSIEINLTLTSD